MVVAVLFPSALLHFHRTYVQVACLFFAFLLLSVLLLCLSIYFSWLLPSRLLVEKESEAPHVCVVQISQQL